MSATVTMNNVSTDPAPSVDRTASRPASLGGKVIALLGVIISCAYLANLGGGIFLEIPDIIPGLGNLDEVFFTTVLLASLAKLGIPILPNVLRGRR
jgi:hypothetical protein